MIPMVLSRDGRNTKLYINAAYSNRTAVSVLSFMWYEFLYLPIKAQHLRDRVRRYVITGNFQSDEENYQKGYFETADNNNDSEEYFGKTYGDGSQGESLDEKAGRFLDLYGDSILRLSYSYVHNIEDAEEILQDTLIRVLSKNPDFKNEAHEKAYLLRTAANLSRNRIEYNDIRSADELDENLISDGMEDLSFVWEAVKSLPVHYREAIHLFYEEGYGVKEIARILGRKESTVRSDLKRGREKLRKILAEEYGYE